MSDSDLMTNARRYLLRVSLMIVVDITFAYVQLSDGANGGLLICQGPPTWPPVGAATENYMTFIIDIITPLLKKTPALTSLLFSSMRGRQQLSCPVLRPPTGPNARPQDNIHLT